MNDVLDTWTRRYERGQQWLKREAELVGVLLWAVGLTLVSALPQMGFTPVYPAVFVALKGVAALVWLLFGQQSWRYLVGRKSSGACTTSENPREILC